jgi:mono/diheme cytochrome c family protein
MKIKWLVLALYTLSSCTQSTFTQGERIFTAKCANCHMEDGQGLQKLIPALTTSNIVKSDVKKTICLILNGVNADSLGSKERYMPSNTKMKDAELTNLINYLQEKFNAQKQEYPISEIKKWRKACEN